MSMPSSTCLVEEDGAWAMIFPLRAGRSPRILIPSEGRRFRSRPGRVDRAGPPSLSQGDTMKMRVFGLAMLGLGLIVGWWCLRPTPVLSQGAGDGPKEGAKVGRYVYVSGGLITVVMIDTQ